MDREEFEARLAAARGAMLRLASLRISARQDAEDVVQEACLKAYRALAHPPRRTDVSDALDALSPRDRELLSRF